MGFSTFSSWISPSAWTFRVIDALVDIILLYILFRLSRWLLHSFLLSPNPFQELSGPPPKSWMMGNLGQLFNAKGLPFHQSLVDTYGGMVRVYGFFGDEQLYVADPRAMNSIILRNQDCFEETAVFTETNKVIFGPGLVATTGEQHKRQRRVVNPIFAVPHLKNLTPVFYDVGEKLADVIENEINNQNKNSCGEESSRKSAVLDISDWMSRVALESVGQTVLGYSFDPLDSPHNNPYTSAIKELIPTLFSLSLVRQFAPFLTRLGSPSFRRKLAKWTPHQAVQKIIMMSDVMHNTAMDILKQKREVLADGALEEEEKDIMSILLRLNEEAKKLGGEQLSDIELTGQMTVLVFGAQDTTSSTLSRVLHLLCLHPDIQDKIREEIQGTCPNGKYGRLDYDDLSALPWLDAVMKETLRLYPPVPFVRRTAVKETVLEFSQTQNDTASVRVPVGTTLFVSIDGANRLESIWGADAKEWKPERWLNVDNSDHPSRLPGIYSGMMSFLGGGRSCVGYRFAQIEMKIIIATLLLRFRMESTEDDVVWNLSQIISPSVRRIEPDGTTSESKGLPLRVSPLVQRDAPEVLG